MRKTLVQFLRYVVVGLLSNAVLFSLYLAFTEAGLSSKISMTLLYLMGVLQTFYFNKRWTFVRRGWSGVEVFRYGMVYGLGYLTNLIGLLVFVDLFGLPHQMVQVLMIVLVSIVVFSIQKFWVFSV